jgi:hypothetical protein
MKWPPKLNHSDNVTVVPAQKHLNDVRGRSVVNWSLLLIFCISTAVLIYGLAMYCGVVGVFLSNSKFNDGSVRPGAIIHHNITLYNDSLSKVEVVAVSACGCIRLQLDCSPEMRQ